MYSVTPRKIREKYDKVRASQRVYIVLGQFQIKETVEAINEKFIYIEKIRLKI